ncbi:hypothetical protein [Flavimaricola marinus]|uniref:hypothetical protein n=1 Tax=Flavimaricola marinus TaxID=1819565 RepID=UPI001055D886|nr:hypothetical protein [Flavimaricola marinus]
MSPTAAELSQMVDEAGGRYAPVAEVLADRGFFPLGEAYGGPHPRAEAGECLEKARGNAIYGFDVVRLCHDGANAVEGVYALQTHSGQDWVEVRSER